MSKKKQVEKSKTSKLNRLSKKAVTASPQPASVQKPLNIADLTTQNGDAMRDLFALGLAFLPTAFESRRSRLDRDGERVDLGPDYRIRIAALNQVLNLCVRGRQALIPRPSGRCQFTLEELREALWEHLLKSGEDPTLALGPRLPTPSARIPTTLRITNPRNISDLTTMHGQAISGLIRLGLASIQGAFTARKLTLDEDGDAVDQGPDSEIGFAAMNLVINLFTRGRRMCPAPAETEKTWTSIEILTACTEAVQNEAADAAREAVDKSRLSGE